jgi:hypothetical protein
VWLFAAGQPVSLAARKTVVEPRSSDPAAQIILKTADELSERSDIAVAVRCIEHSIAWVRICSVAFCIASAIDLNHNRQGTRHWSDRNQDIQYETVL